MGREGAPAPPIITIPQVRARTASKIPSTWSDSNAQPAGLNRLGLSVGELVALVRGVAQRGQEEYHQLQQEIRASPVVYGDETGWREDGRNGYL